MFIVKMGAGELRIKLFLFFFCTSTYNAEENLKSSFSFESVRVFMCQGASQGRFLCYPWCLELQGSITSLPGVLWKVKFERIQLKNMSFWTNCQTKNWELLIISGVLTNKSRLWLISIPFRGSVMPFLCIFHHTVSCWYMLNFFNLTGTKIQTIIYAI